MSAPARLPEGPLAQSVRLAFRFLFLLVLGLAVAWAGSNIRRVPSDSRAVVLRLGAIVRLQGAGLVLAWPRPIEQVLLIPAADRQIELRISRFDEHGFMMAGRPPEFQISTDARGNAGFLLTGDGGVVHLQASVFYQISDPLAFVVAEAHVRPALERIFAASAAAVCAARDLDEILVARPEEAGMSGGRERLRADLVRAMNQRLAALAAAGASERPSAAGAGLGVTVSRIDLAAALPSNAKAAFDRVLTVTQTANQLIAEARSFATTSAAKAEQQAHRIVADAEAAAAERRSDALARAARIAALAPQLKGELGQVLLTRLYADRVGAVLRRAGEVDSVEPGAAGHLYLPGPSLPAPSAPPAGDSKGTRP